MIEALTLFEQSILLFIQNNLRVDFLDPIVVFITRLGDTGVAWIALGVVLLFFKKTRRGGLIMLFCLAGAWLVNDFVLKPLIARVRPYDAIDTLTILVKAETSFSFPSGHTNASFASAIALTMVYGRKGAWAYLPATLIALSRLYVGVHYPTDVLGGMIVGTVVGFLVYKLFIYIEKNHPNRKRQS